MKQLDLKKLLLPNLPYLLIGLYATKLGEAWRLAPGADASAKLLGLITPRSTARTWNTVLPAGVRRRTSSRLWTRCLRITSFSPRRSG